MMSLVTIRRLSIVCTIAAVLVLAVACSSASRYEVLSFFFDGVPDPESGEVDVPEPPPKPLTDFQKTVAALPKPEPTPSGPVIVSVHKPVAEGKCRECHNLDLGFQEIQRGADLCDKCHKEQRIEQGWDHGPINLGTCVPCHRSHESIYPHLLDAEIPDLCLRCHNELMDRNDKYHQVETLADCTSCHDPHMMY